MLSNKRGTINETMIFWLIDIGFLIAVLVLLHFTIQAAFTNINYGSREMDAAIVANSLMHSDVLMHRDTLTGRLYPGVLDETKVFNFQELEENLALLLTTQDSVNYMALRITIAALSGEAYYNEASFRRWHELYKGGFTRGSGGYVYQNYTYPVQVGIDGRQTSLSIEILVPRG